MSLLSKLDKIRNTLATAGLALAFVGILQYNIVSSKDSIRTNQSPQQTTQNPSYFQRISMNTTFTGVGLMGLSAVVGCGIHQLRKNQAKKKAPEQQYRPSDDLNYPLS